MRWLTIIPLPLMVVMAGCGPSAQYVYKKPRVTQEERQRDESECRRQAMVAVSGDYGRSYQVFEQGFFTRCMASRGYEVQEKKE